MPCWPEPFDVFADEIEHNCGTCKTNLTNPRAKKTCLGVHQEVCCRYHKTLFFVGESTVRDMPLLILADQDLSQASLIAVMRKHAM